MAGLRVLFFFFLAADSSAGSITACTLRLERDGADLGGLLAGVTLLREFEALLRVPAAGAMRWTLEVLLVSE